MTRSGFSGYLLVLDLWGGYGEIQNLSKAIYEEIKARDWVLGYGAHDHTAIKDKELSQIAFLLQYAQDKGIGIKSYKNFYKEMREKWRN